MQILNKRLQFVLWAKTLIKNSHKVCSISSGFRDRQRGFCFQVQVPKRELKNRLIKLVCMTDRHYFFFTKKFSSIHTKVLLPVHFLESFYPYPSIPPNPIVCISENIPQKWTFIWGDPAGSGQCVWKKVFSFRSTSLMRPLNIRTWKQK